MKSLLGRLQLDQDKIITRNISNNEVFPGYKKYIEKNDFAIYRAELIRPMIVAAFNNVVVTRKMNSDTIKIYPDYRNRIIKYSVRLSTHQFPNLILNSHIAKVFVIPYLREIENDKYSKRWRVVIITDKCQVYHNFPKRDTDIDGYECFGDITHFEESAIWDIPNRKYPSQGKNCDETESWFPCLPKSCYEYHPPVNQKSIYGNNGFDKYTIVTYKNIKVKVSRFYFPNRSILSNPFIYMGGFETDYKMTVLGTYQSNKGTGSRISVFATSDGGRNWYAKIDFGDEGVYDFRQGSNDWGLNYGNKLSYRIDFNDKLQVSRRFLNHNGDGLFHWEKPIEIEDVRTDSEIIIKTKDMHSFSTGNIVTFQSVGYISEKWEWLINNDINKNSSGNGVLFKVEVIDEKSFYIRESIMNPFTNIACRHVHHINRLRDGWIIGTGEIYPNGWLIYMQMMESDTYSVYPASSEFTTHVLNHCRFSVQRTLGADIRDEKEPILVFASDHDTLERCMKVGENSIKRNSTGIYIGYLKDIEDFSKFRIMYEAKEPAYFFKKLDNHYVFSGQRGELAISVRNAWVTGKTDEPMVHYLGSTCHFHVIDKYLVVFRR